MSCLNNESIKELNELNNCSKSDVYVIFYSLSDYNNGVLIPFCIDLRLNDTYEQYLDSINDSLEIITNIINDGQVREEFILCDCEGVPTEYVNEFSIDKEYFDYFQALNSSGMDSDIFAAGVDLGIPFEKIEEAYAGYYDSAADFAQAMADNCCDMEAVGRWPFDCIDWDRAAGDLMFDYSESGGYYFSSNY